MEKKKTYFEKLYDSLCNDDGQEGPFIQLDGDIIGTPEQLKKYLFNIIKSNMNYDFGIAFDDNDVIEFMTASLTDYINSKNYSTMKAVNDDNIDDSTLQKLSDAYTARTSLSILDDINKYTVDELADVCILAKEAWMKDEQFYSEGAIFDALALMMNDGIKVKDMMEKPIRELLVDIYDRIPA